MTTPSPDHVRRYRLALLGTVLALPVAVALLGCVVLLVALPHLPAQVVLHWGVEGTRTGSPLVALACLPITVVLSGAIWLLVRRPEQVRRSARARIVVAAPTWIACVVTIALVGSVVLQGRPGPAAPVGPAVLGVVVGLLAAAAVAATMPEPPAAPEPARPTAVPRPAAGDRLAWFGRATPAPVVLGVVIGFLGLVVVGVVLAGLASGTAVAWVALLPAAVLVLAVSMLSWRVRIDRTGVTAVGALGFPRLSVPAAEIAEAGVGTVAPIGDFGGYGLRHAAHATGVITRAGDALEVLRRDGRRLVLTVDRPADAAGVAQALLLPART